MWGLSLCCRRFYFTRKRLPKKQRSVFGFAHTNRSAHLLIWRNQTPLHANYENTRAQHTVPRQTPSQNIPFRLYMSSNEKLHILLITHYRRGCSVNWKRVLRYFPDVFVQRFSHSFDFILIWIKSIQIPTTNPNDFINLWTESWIVSLTRLKIKLLNIFQFDLYQPKNVYEVIGFL